MLDNIGDWFGCPHCNYRHPWKPGAKACPNNRPKLVDKCPPEDIVRPVVDIAVDKPVVIKNAAYWRERKRAQRAAKRAGQK